MFHSRMLPAAVLFLLVCHSGTAFSRVYYVRWDVVGGGTGLTWGQALCHPQLAVDLAEDGDEVWVAVGVYDYPVFGHDAVLEMKSGVAVYGGFGGAETSREQRDRNTYQSVLEGYFYSFCDEHVVLGAGNAILDGFWIVNGLATDTNNPPLDKGAGMYNSPDCSDLTVRNCVFYNNWAYYGGAVFNDSCCVSLVNCLFCCNYAYEDGGAVYNSDASPSLFNCTVIANEAWTNGGAMYNRYSAVTATNCIFWNNTAESSEQVCNFSAQASVTYSDVEGGYGGIGNIDEYPRFADGWDFHLRNGSPCIDRGILAGAPADDLEGNPRDRSPDMGAYEYLAMKVISPNGGEVWEVGSSREIAWSCGADGSAVDISYSVDGGATWISIAADVWNPDDTYLWQVPDNVDSARCRVLVERHGGVESDTSDECFTIASIVCVLSPDGGEVWDMGSSQTVAWTTTGPVTTVDVEYSSDDGATWFGIIEGVADTGTWQWNPVTGPPTSAGRVRIRANTDSAAVDVSDGVFTITGVQLLWPNGGEQCGVGTLQTIAWASAGVDNLRVELSRNGGTSWGDIIASTSAAAGSYPWVVTHGGQPVPQTSCLVRISNVADAAENDVSDAAFAIVTPEISLDVPNGGEKWFVESSQFVCWTTTGLAYLHIEISRDGGITWKTVAPSADACIGTFDWTVQGSASETCLLRISDPQNSSLRDESDAPFVIEDVVTFTTVMSGRGCWSDPADTRPVSAFPFLLAVGLLAVVLAGPRARRQR